MAAKDSRNTCCHLQVLGLGTDTRDTVPSVLLFFDNERYLFNVGEGFQRFCIEHKIKPAKINGMFLTRTTTEAAGGLPGVLLTLADKVGSPLTGFGNSLSLYGPRGTHDFANCLRTYVNVKDINLVVTETSSGESQSGGSLLRRRTLLKNSVVEISSILLDGDQPTEDCTRSEKRMRVASGGNSHGNGSIASPSPCGLQVACYLIELLPIPGKFLPQKAAKLGVKSGPAFGMLCRGETVVAANGNEVKPEDVMEPETPGPIAVIVDCPSLAYLREITESTGLVEYAAKEKGDLVVMHLSPPDVLATEEYGRFLSSWPERADHIVVNGSQSHCQAIFASSRKLQKEMHAYFPEYFPEHKCNPPDDQQANELSNRIAGTIQGLNMLKYHLRPRSKHGVDESDVAASATSKDDEDGVGSSEKKPIDASKVHQQISLTRKKLEEHGEQNPSCLSAADALEVTFLGTGAAIPSKYRNLSAIYCHVFDKGGFLLDSGEGVCGQLMRRYGRTKFREILMGLKLVWISHIHADHHSGLPSLLRMRHQYMPHDPLVVVGPRPLRRILHMYSRVESMPMHFIDCSETTIGDDGNGNSHLPSRLASVLSQLGIKAFESVEVIHSCLHSYGVVLESTVGWKLSYSGDTRPCAAFVRRACNSTVFIHEATFEEDLIDEAMAKKHSTTTEAIRSGKEANAYRTILTHFSQRYPKMPVVDESFADSTCVAFDLLTFNLTNLQHLPAIVPAAEMLLSEEKPEEEEE